MIRTQSGSLALACVLVPALVSWGAETIALYRTGFEATAGYVNGTKLEGTDGWVGWGEEYHVGENGITNGVFAGHGQQAFIGRSLNAVGARLYAVYRPLNWRPPTGGGQRVRFSVNMSITRSTGAYWDNFYWSVYNTQTQPLFSVDFDNWFKNVNVWLEGGSSPHDTGVVFTNDVMYRLEIWMDFDCNRWGATLGDAELAAEQPITLTGASLTLGDIDAVWEVYYAGYPGENCMVFDDCEVVIERVFRPVISLWSRAPDGYFTAHVTGAEPGRTYVVQFSPALGPWQPCSTNTANPDGAFDFVDRSVAAVKQRFYRVQTAP